MQGFPLPAAATLWANHPHSEDLRSTYSFVLEAEKATVSKLEGRSVSTERTALHALNAICARLVGYLILEPLNDVAQNYVLNEVEVCRQRHGTSEGALNAAIYELGLFYMNHFVRPFKRSRWGCTPRHSGPDTPKPPLDKKEDYTKKYLTERPTSHTGAKCTALIRDNHRCMVCQKYDVHSILSIQELQVELEALVANAEVWKNGGVVCVTRCCHIISNSSDMDLSNNEERPSATSLWTVLANFGEPSLRHELDGVKVHRLDNILTLGDMAQDAFDSLCIWFDKAEPSDPNDHHYYLGTSYRESLFALMHFPSEVRFVNHAPDPDKFPLPNPRYLRIHAACAKVGYMSGATEYIDKVLRDVEEGYELAEDGSSVDLLTHALLRLTPVGDYDT